MYDRSDGGKIIRQNCGVSLGWWHTYKHVALTVWEKFAPTVFAPLFHFLYPGTQFYEKSKNLTHVLAMFQCCMTAYRDIYPQLRRDVADVGLSMDIRRPLEELMFVLDFALPVVPASHCYPHLYQT
jgi:hypothetical protein